VPVPPTTIRNGTLIFKDEGSATELRLDAIDATLAADPKYGGAAAKGRLAYNNEPLNFDLAVADASAALAGRMTPLTLAIDSRILTARLAGEAALGESPMLAGEIDATSPSARELAVWLGIGDSVPPTIGALTLKSSTAPGTTATRAIGSVVLRDAPVTYDLALASLRETLAGKPSAVKGAVAGQGLAAELDGTLHLAAENRYQGALSAKTDSIGTLATRLGVTNAAVKALGPGTLKSTVDARASAVTLTGAEFDADGRTGTYTGTIALAGPRPRVTGDLALSRLDLDALLGRAPAPPATALESAPADDGFETTFDVLSAELDAIENPPPPALSLEAAPAATGWSTSPIDLKALRSVDLDLALTLGTVKFGQLPLGKARLKTKLDNGELAATIEDVAIGQGSGSGQIALKARGTAHDAAIGLKLLNVDAEPVTTELSGKPLLKGASAVDIATRATGRSIAELVSTLDGTARIDMKNGKLRGWDLGAMVAELWNYKGWGYTPSRNTPVDRLTAKYTIKSGTVRSTPDLTMKGPTAGLRSTGNIVVPRRLIDQTVDVESLFFNIVIKGDWTKKLWIGPAFLAGIQQAPGAAPEAAATSAPAAELPRALPADLAARIERILADKTAAARLTAAQRAFLEQLKSSGGSGS
jgi:AsmA protein